VAGITYAELTDRGLVRRRNEDAHLACAPGGAAFPSARGVLFAVADGLGGLAHGEVASREAVKCAEELFLGGRLAPEAFAGAALREANRRIWELNRPKPPEEWMATTLTLALFAGDRLRTGHVGDCRLYRARGDAIVCLTRDHTLDRHTLTKALGIEADVEPDCGNWPAEKGDAFVLCSDGLYPLVSPAELREALAGGDLAQSARGLVRLANARGGPDNVTVQLIRIG
jgi:protein phosphatase